MPKLRFPPHCPAFLRVYDGEVGTAAPSVVQADGWLFFDTFNASGEHMTPPVDVRSCVPLTPSALLVYVAAGGDETTLDIACQHKRGRKPARLYDEAEAYVTRADRREEGY